MSSYVEGMLLARLQASAPRVDDPVVDCLHYKAATRMLRGLLGRLGICRKDTGTGADVPAFAWHAFRHACVARWIHAGIDLTKIMRWAGHKHPATTLNTYAYVLRERTAITGIPVKVPEATPGVEQDPDYGSTEPVSRPIVDTRKDGAMLIREIKICQVAQSDPGDKTRGDAIAEYPRECRIDGREPGHDVTANGVI